VAVSSGRCDAPAATVLSGLHHRYARGASDRADAEAVLKIQRALAEFFWKSISCRRWPAASAIRSPRLTRQTDFRLIRQAKPGRRGKHGLTFSGDRSRGQSHGMRTGWRTVVAASRSLRHCGIERMRTSVPSQSGSVHRFLCAILVQRGHTLQPIGPLEL